MTTNEKIIKNELGQILRDMESAGSLRRNGKVVTLDDGDDGFTVL
jgi:hypothetical protein